MKLLTNLLKKSKLVVIKIGTKILMSPTGKVYNKNFETLAKQVSQIREKNCPVIIVTSGSVGMGMSIWNISERPNALNQKQACAALGQGELIHLYSKTFKKHKQRIAQILISDDDFKNKQRCTHFKNTLTTLLKKGVIPIINENDTISTQEIKVGDNDKLSADVSVFMGADLLIMLSDEKGFYTKNPKKYSDTKLISVVPEITRELVSLAKGAGSSNSVGGMRSKIKAIKQANRGNILVALMNLGNSNLTELFSGHNFGTLFLPSKKKLGQNKKWLGLISNSKGKIIIDDGAVNALQKNNSSLLLVGVLSFKRAFKAKDFVDIISIKGDFIARGQVSYSSKELKSFLSSTVKPKSKTVIHRDYLVIF